HGADEIVDYRRAENVRVVQLAFVLRLDAEIIEGRVDGIGVRGLRAAIRAHPSENFIVITEAVVSATAQQPFFVAAGNGLRPRLRASSVLQACRQGGEIETSATSRG